MFRFLFFATTLASASVSIRSTALTNSNNEICPTSNALTFPTCHNEFSSVCSTGDTFLNKVTVVDKTFLNGVNTIVARRKISARRAQRLGNDIFNKLDAERYGILKTMSDNDLNAWINYFKKLIDASTKTEAHNVGKGACGEAAKASIANSLFKQLETGTRETVQLVTLQSSQPILSFPNSVHVFVIYNGKPIKSRHLKGNDDLDQLMKNIPSENAQNPVMTCDSWIGYHDNSANWLKQVKAGKDHVYGSVTWEKIEVADYTIPSLRKAGITAAQRKFLINLMKNDILKPGIRSLDENEITKSHLSYSRKR